MTETIITATEASRSFSDLLHRVCYGGESFVIKKGSRVMARIAPVEVEVSTEFCHSRESGNPSLLAPARTKSLSGADAPFDGSPLGGGDDTVDEPLPENVTPEEAEYFKSVIEQIRKAPA